MFVVFCLKVLAHLYISSSGKLAFLARISSFHFCVRTGVSIIKASWTVYRHNPLLLRTRDVPGSNLSPETVYPGSLWFSSVSPSKWWDGIVTLVQ
jgi:hypothetical protein